MLPSAIVSVESNRHHDFRTNYTIINRLLRLGVTPCTMKKSFYVSLLFLILSVPAIAKGCLIARELSSASIISQYINWGDTIHIPAEDTLFHIHIYYYFCNGPQPPVSVLRIKDSQGVMHTSNAGDYNFT